MIARLCARSGTRVRVCVPQPGESAPEGERRARRIFRVWLVLFGVVGAQMAWVLKPFIGNPKLPFEWVRPTRASHFFEFMARSLTDHWK